jgi:tetratricopeptide (TPR) repeat protein
MNVFLPRFTDRHEKFIMASQADRLRMSECFKKSKDLSCLTCHHPHRSVEVTPVSQYNNACRNCHTQQEKVLCTAPVAERQAKGNNCVDCHMPRSGSVDIPHVRITDHRIGIRNTEYGIRNDGKPEFLGLEILTKENPTPLDMARGYLATYDKYIAAPVMLDSARFYLEQSKEPFEKKFSTLVHYLFQRRDYEGIMKNLAKMPAGRAYDAWTNYRIGEAFFQSGINQQALEYFEKATEKLPYHLDFQEKEGMTLVSLKRLAEGKKKLEWVLAENPKRPVALCNLGFAHVLSGDLEKGMRLYDRAIALDPDYEQALLNKAALLIFSKRRSEAEKLLRRILKKNPENAQALKALQSL